MGGMRCGEQRLVGEWGMTSEVPDAGDGNEDDALDDSRQKRNSNLAAILTVEIPVPK